MAFYEFRADKDSHGFAGYVKAVDLPAAARVLLSLGFADITYLALATTPDPGVPVWEGVS